MKSADHSAEIDWQSTALEDMTVEVLAERVWLLSCGCIQSESRPAPQPHQVRPRDVGVVMPPEPQRVVATMNTSPAYRRDFIDPAHQHGTRMIQLPIQDWLDQHERGTWLRM